jgi:hypothetical protein
MINFFLHRFHNPEFTVGVLFMEDTPLCVTIERAWRDNRRNISCIPEGRYKCRRVVSPRFGTTFEVIGVPGRSNILFHAGNTAGDSRGCILLGEKFGKLKGRTAVLNSKKMFNKFMEVLRDIDSIYLEICTTGDDNGVDRW